jgi:hypothetical protein
LDLYVIPGESASPVANSPWRAANGRLRLIAPASKTVL